MVAVQSGGLEERRGTAGHVLHPLIVSVFSPASGGAAGGGVERSVAISGSRWRAGVDKPESSRGILVGRCLLLAPPLLELLGLLVSIDDSASCLC
ncbi:hypothetical protein ABZP36_031125 [Zizania latifolia]